MTYKTIQLTNCNESTIVDEDYFDELSKYSWQLFKSSGHVGRCQWIDGSPKTILMHRVVNNTPDGLFTDHMNMDKLDNRRINLRTCTKGQNSMNRIKQKGTYSSKYKGVSWCKTKGKWKARVKSSGKVISLGYHDSELQAAFRYDMVAKDLHGAFFVPNILGSVAVWL